MRVNKMASKAELDINSYIHPQSNVSAQEKSGPMIIEGGEGVHVFDDQGNKYLDSVAGLWCVTLGYNNPAIKDAAAKQMDQLPFFQTLPINQITRPSNWQQSFLKLRQFLCLKLFFKIQVQKPLIRQ
jgi:4-aminobutyrate---pyruvate transaminase